MVESLGGWSRLSGETPAAPQSGFSLIQGFDRENPEIFSKMLKKSAACAILLLKKGYKMTTYSVIAIKSLTGLPRYAHDGVFKTIEGAELELAKVKSRWESFGWYSEAASLAVYSAEEENAKFWNKGIIVRSRW